MLPTTDEIFAQIGASAYKAGREAGRSAGTWVSVAPEDADSILNDVDPMVLDSYGSGPNLSGENADEPTNASVFADAASDCDLDVDDMQRYMHSDAFCGLVQHAAGRWEEGVFETWNDALQASALSVTS